MENKIFFDLINGHVAMCKSKMTAWGLIRNARKEEGKQPPILSKILTKNHAHSMKHIPTDEEWFVIGIDIKGNRVCAAGYPPSIGDLTDCVHIEELRPLTDDELQYREKQFGSAWF